MYSAYKLVRLKERIKPLGTGWLPSLPDLRDYTHEHRKITAISRRLGLNLLRKRGKTLPRKVDISKWCSPVEDQGSIGSCTAHAGVGIVEYFQRRAFGKHINGSRLFVYKTTRNLMGVTGDTGAWLRSTMGALVTFGVPPEKYWLYTDLESDFDKEPTAFVYSIADNFEALKYFCHDPEKLNLPYNEVLLSIRKFLAAGIPLMFGFYGFDSFDNADEPAHIPFPCPGEQIQWGHAVVAVGYDDRKEITNMLCNRTTIGALKIRNSWGITWGQKGYGWLPYEYVLQGLASDFWSLLSMQWVNTGNFGL